MSAKRSYVVAHCLALSMTVLSGCSALQNHVIQNASGPGFARTATSSSNGVWIKLYSPIDGQRIQPGETLRISGRILNKDLFGRDMSVKLVYGTEKHSTKTIEEKTVHISEQGTLKGTFDVPKELPPQASNTLKYPPAHYDITLPILDSRG